jgi:hypothetical protein
MTGNSEAPAAEAVQQIGHIEDIGLLLPIRPIVPPALTMAHK